MTEYLHGFQHDHGNIKSYPKGTAAIDKGNIVCLASGYAITGANASGYRTVGVARKTMAADTANGDSQQEVLVGDFEFDVNGSFAVDDVGETAYVYDGHTISLSPGTYGTAVGQIVGFISSTRARVHIRGIHGPGILTADADATYGAPEAALLNEVKAWINSYGAK